MLAVCLVLQAGIGQGLSSGLPLAACRALLSRLLAPVPRQNPSAPAHTHTILTHTNSISPSSLPPPHPAPQARRSRQPYPRLLFLITGRGPQRAAYEEKMRRMDLTHVAFRTVWLEPGDYPLLLGSADLGVSLHASSSGLDLPMKVCGCGLFFCICVWGGLGRCTRPAAG